MSDMRPIRGIKTNIPDILLWGIKSEGMDNNVESYGMNAMQRKVVDDMRKNGKGLDCFKFTSTPQESEGKHE